MIRKATDCAARRILRRLGYSHYMAKILWKDLKEDLRNPDIGFRKRVWAYRRGFFGITAMTLELDDSNYRDYENDFHHLRLHPLDGRFARWIDDKLTYKYILHPFDEYLPKYYFHLRQGTTIKLMDCPKELPAEPDSVIRLLEKKEHLALKAMTGYGGSGFCKLSFDGAAYQVNGHETGVGELRALLERLADHIVTEYVSSHESFCRVSLGSPWSVRVITVRDDSDGTVIVAVLLRIGTTKSGVVDNTNAGGLPAGVDLDTGRIFGFKSWEDGRLVDGSVHPDSGLPIPEKVPHWDLITDKLGEIGEYLAQIRFMGFDIIVTDDGFKIIEINSHPGVYLVQLYYPMLKNRYVRKLFYGES